MASLAIIGLLAMPTTAVAVDEDIAAQLKHYIDCLTWLVTDPPMHEANCMPSRPFDMPANAAAIVSMLGPTTSPSAWEDCDPFNSLCEEPHCDPETSETNCEISCNPETETCEISDPYNSEELP